LSAAAQAQSAPATTPTPPPTAKHVHEHTKRASFSHLPIIDVVPILTQPGPIATAAQTKNYDPLDVGGTITIPIAQRLSFSFDRIVGSILDQASGPVLINNAPTYPALFRDVVLVQRLDYQAAPGLVLEGGFSFRHRTEGVGVSGAPFPYTVSSSEAHDGYLAATYTTRPIRALANSRFIFGITGEDQPVDHHVAVLNPATNIVSYIDENPHKNQYYESTEQVGVIVPIDRHGLTFTARDAFGAVNFYENSPFPYRVTSYATLSLTKKFNDYFSLTMREGNSVYAKQGYPFPTPNAMHTETVDVLADFHVDLNSMFHHN
jgi:hypothetical protein